MYATARGDGSLRVQASPEAAALEDELTRSLRIPHDDRYRKMERYRGNGREHFSRLVERQSMTVMNQPTLDAPRLPGIAPLEREQVSHVGIGDRAEWQDAFDRSVRRLFVDFELSDVPSCRLNHLERMHSWFLEHGGKQQRKVDEGPRFLLADRNLEAPAGSTRNVPVKQVERPLATGFTSAAPGTPRRQRLVPPLTSR